MRLSLLTLIAGLSALLAQEQRLADVMVPAGAPIVLEVPIRTYTSAIISRVLRNLPYGIEQAPMPAETPQLDMAQKPDRTIALNGMRVGEALDAIVREDPRYEWSEVNGRVIIRLAGARGIGALDARIKHYAVENASFVDALAALATAIDPARSKPVVGGIGVNFQSGRETLGALMEQTAVGKRVTMSVQDATLLEILEAIARRHGSLTWRIDYGTRAPSLANASITFNSGFATATVSAATVGDRVASKPRFRVPMIRQMDGLILLYTRRARVQTGIELITEPRKSVPVDAPGIDVTDLTPSEAIARLVATDSRYSWDEEDEFFIIGPTSDYAPATGLLDYRVASFELSDATATSALKALVGVLGGVQVRISESEGGIVEANRAEQQRRIAAGRARTGSMKLVNASVGQVLTALCREHGTLSWVVQLESSSPAEQRYSIVLDSYDGWSIHAMFEIPTR